MRRNIVLIATLDTKALEAGYIKGIIETMGHRVTVIDAGIFEPKLKSDISRHEIANAAGSNISTLVSQRDEGKASEVMAKGATKIVKDLYDAGKVNGVIAIGGSMGTAICTAPMRALPIGIPKVMVSTVASTNVRQYVGTKDITMVHPVTDFLGLNRINKRVLANAAAAVAAMADVKVEVEAKRPLVGMTLTGAQQATANQIKNALESKGYEVAAFHCYESSALDEHTKNGVIDAGVIDLSLLDLMCALVDPEGEFAAGPERLEIAGRMGLPHVVVPGCADFISLRPNQIPQKWYKERKIHVHNPQLFAIKSTVDELLPLARIICEKLNKTRGPTALIVPTRSFSMHDALGAPAGFYDLETKRSFTQELKKGLNREKILYMEVDAQINDPEFADTVLEVFCELVRKREK